MNRMLRLLCAAACLLLLLAGCGKKEIEPPEFYQIGDDQAITLDTCLGAEHENGKLASITEPAEDASAEVYSYTYEELTTLNATLQEYVAKLKAEDQGFVEANSKFIIQEELQDLTAPEGTVILARPGIVEGKVFQVILTWTETGCTIEVSRPEGELKEPPPPEEPRQSQQSTSLPDMMTYVQTLNPSQLGLSGASMSEYRVVPMEGLQMLNGAPCRQFNVYHQDENGVNAFMGSYLVGSDNALYLLDLESDEAVSLEAASTPASPEAPAPSSSASPSSSEEPQTPAE